MAIKRPIPRAEGVSDKVNDEVLFSSYSIIMKSGKTLQEEWDEHLLAMEELKKGLGSVKEFVGENIPIPYQKNKLTYSKGVYQEPTWSGNNPQFMTVTGQLSGTNADEYRVTFKLISDEYTWSDGTKKDQPVSWYIDRQPFKVDPVQAEPIPEYNGDMKYPTWVDLSDIELEYVGGKKEESQAGIHSISLKPRSNYCWHDETYGEREFHWKIARKKISLPVQTNTLWYDGKTQRPSWDVSDTLITKVDGADEGIDAKTYDIWFKPSGNAMWEDGSDVMKKTTWKISEAALKADITGPGGKLSDIEIPFNGNDLKPDFLNYNPDLVDAVDVTVNEDGTVTESKTLTHRNVGAYTTKFTPNGNTSWSSGERTPILITWEITPMPVKVPYIKYKDVTSDIKIPYEGSETGPDIMDQDTTWVIAEGIKGDEVKGYTAKFILKEANNTFWEGGGTQPKTYDWQITPCLVKVPELTESVVVYDNGNPVSPTIEPYNTNLIKVSDNVAYNVGDNYKVKFELIYPQNCAWEHDLSTGPQYKPWSVTTLAVAPPVLTGSKFTYEKDKEQGPEVSAYDTQQISVTDYRKTGAGRYTAVISLLKRGAVWSDTNDNKNKTFDWSIDPKPIQTPSVTSTESKIYNKETQYVIVSGHDGEKEFIINGGAGNSDGRESKYLKISGASGKIASNYEVIMELTDKNNTVWDTGGTDIKTVPWRISKKYFNVPAVTGTYTYDDGKELTCNFTGFDDNYMTVTGNKASAVGPHDAVFTLTDLDNTAWSDTKPDEKPVPKTVTWNIEAVNFDPSVLSIHNADVTYDGVQHTVTAANITGFSDDLLTLGGDIVKTAAGKYTAKVYLKDTTKNKWTDGRAATDSVDLVWNISKRVMTVPVITNANTAYEYTGSTITITADQCTFGDIKDKDFIVLKNNTGTDAGEHTLYFAIGTNHADSCVWTGNITVDQPGTWKINKAYLKTWSISDSSVDITGAGGSHVDITVTRTGNGEVKAKSSDPALMSVEVIDAKSVSVNPTVRIKDEGGIGNAVAIISVEEGDNHFSSADSSMQNPATCKPSLSCSVSIITKKSPEDFTPEQIAEIVKKGYAPSMWDLGTKIPIYFNSFALSGKASGSKAPAGKYYGVIIGYDHNKEKENPDAAHTMTIAVMKHNTDLTKNLPVYFQNQVTHLTNDSTMAFWDSYMAPYTESTIPFGIADQMYCENIRKAMDERWQNIIIETTKSDYGTVKVFQMSYYEVHGTDNSALLDYGADDYKDGKQQQYDYFKQLPYSSNPFNNKIYGWRHPYQMDKHNIHVASRTLSTTKTYENDLFHDSYFLLTSEGYWYDWSATGDDSIHAWKYNRHSLYSFGQFNDNIKAILCCDAQVGIVPCFVIGG